MHSYNLTQPAHALTIANDIATSCAAPFNAAAAMSYDFWNTPLMRHAMPGIAGLMAGFAAVAVRTTRAYGKPAFAIPGLWEEVVMDLPFARLIRFVGAEATSFPKPRVLLVAPMSGHYATLLRHTAQGLARDHDVHITDWRSAADVPYSAGTFSLDTYMTYIQRMIREFQGDVHVIAVCQPGPAVLGAIAGMEAAGDPSAPKSMTLMGSPIDTRINPGAVNTLATTRGLRWFEDNVISIVPHGFSGQGRRIYPGFLQRTGFIAMNPKRHADAGQKLFDAARKGDMDAITAHDKFYDEYNAVADLSADFYLDTIRKVFIEHHLPRGVLTHEGQPVDLTSITRTALMTVEGGRDDITPPGQCMAAHDLCPNLPATKKAHLLQPESGHYGIFSGSKWESQVLPQLSAFIATHDARQPVPPRAAVLAIAR